MQKVIPQALNYADLKPESIESQIKLVRFTPTQAVTSYKPGDVVRFMLQSQGFFDPYSAYIKITVTVDPSTFCSGNATGAPGIVNNFGSSA